jgi:hypothetical protein
MREGGLARRQTRTFERDEAGRLRIVDGEARLEIDLTVARPRGGPDPDAGYAMPAGSRRRPRW